MSKTGVSVVLATYNGEKYLREQLDSILNQLGQDDELIISDDHSKDNTIEIIEEYIKKYPIIKFVKGPGKGYIYNFEFLIKQTEKDIILISDQDDVWMPNKVERVRQEFEKNKDIWVALHDAEYIDETGHALSGQMFKIRNAQKGFFQNWIKSAYYGCCMAFSKEYKNIIMPFPMHLFSYDQWIGLLAELFHKSAFIYEPLIERRLHGNNETTKRGFWYRIAFRLVVMLYTIILAIRYVYVINKR